MVNFFGWDIQTEKMDHICNSHANTRLCEFLASPPVRGPPPQKMNKWWVSFDKDCSFSHCLGIDILAAPPWRQFFTPVSSLGAASLLT